jgi:FKBP-type peptidyl-prolyl cis-trans isomerase FkpA
MRHLLLAAALVLTACRPSSGGSQVQVAGRPESLTYVPELKVDLTNMSKQASGLYLQDLTVGTGAVATPGSTVDVHYTGWLADGRKFDSSRGGAPFSFTIGRGMVIPGWDEGVAGMKVGGKRKLVLPPELGYGEAGAGGVIPPGATLVFEVELLGVR